MNADRAGAPPPCVPERVLGLIEDPVLLLDAARRVTWANPAARRLLDLPATDGMAPVLDTLLRLTDEADRPLHVDTRTTTPWRAEARLFVPPSAVRGRPARVSASADGQGGVALVLRLPDADAPPAPLPAQAGMAWPAASSLACDARQRLSLDDAGVVQFSLEAGTGRLRYSAAAAALYGGPDRMPRDLDDVGRVMHPEDRPRMVAALEAAFRGEPLDEECRVLGPDGEVHWIVTVGRLVRDADGRPLRIEGIKLDRSAQRRAEAALRDTETHFRHLFESVPMSIALIDPDTLKLLAFNTKAHEALGYGRDEFAHLRVDVLDADQSSEEIRANLRRVVAQPGPLVFESRHRARDGRIREVSLTCQRIEEAGRMLVYAVWLDITERKRVENEMIEARRRLRAILDNTSAMVYVNDRAGRVIDVNRSYEQVFGRAVRDIVGRRIDELFSPDEAAAMRANDARVIAAREQMVFEEQVRTEGTLRTYLSVKAPLLDERGEPYAICGISTDITAIKTAEQALRDLDRRKDEFLAMLAHELRNPLAPLGNAAELMHCIECDDPTLDTVREIIERQVRHLARLVDDLMDVSRITQGKVALKRQPLDLRAVLNAAAEHARPLIASRAHALQIDAARPLPVTGDPTRLAQVFGNLLTNAAKYTPHGGQIRVATGIEDGCCVVRVIDDGMGIGADLLPLVFNLFTQGDRGLDRSEGGLGIGLSVVRSLVELHGGRVSAESDGPGRGSVFTVRLPLRETATDAVDAPAAPAAGRLVAGGRVLIVDDNADAADSLATLLALRGHQPVVAYDPVGALEVLEQPGRFDTMILDIGLPGMDGYALAERIRAMPRHADTTLIALTGYGQGDDVRRAMQAGFDLHMTKPADLERLERALREVRHRAPTVLTAG